MGFQLDGRGLPGLENWIKALSRWQATKPWRGYSEAAPRPLDRSRRKSHTTIRKLPDDSIACTLHSTDVVVFHPDDSVTLTSYRSISTDVFAREILGWGSGLTTSFNYGGYVNLSVAIVKLAQATRFKRVAGVWTVMTPETLAPIEEYVLDKPAARAALKATRYHEYVTWINAVEALGGRQSFTEEDRVAAYSQTSLELLAAGPEMWRALAYKCTDARLRKAIYAQAKCVRVQTHMSAPDWSVLHRIRRSQAMWQYVL